MPQESFWHMVLHFFYDITHFDGKFFITVKDLIFRPGFLSREYTKGRRVKYLHPVRMYVFTSAVFFLLFFNFFKSEEAFKTNVNMPLPREERNEYIKTLEKKLAKDTANLVLKRKLLCAKDTSCPLTLHDVIEEESNGLNISISGSNYKTYSEYDSAQHRLPSSKRDGWFMRRLNKKAIELNTRFKENPDEASKELGESILHRLPYMLFISLPLFALLLKLVYVRRKQFYFMDHGIFTIHLYIFSFLLLLVVFGVSKLGETFNWSITGLIITILFIGLQFYLYKAMRNFYGQRRFKTFVKFMIVAFFSFLMLAILFGLFIFFSAVIF